MIDSLSSSLSLFACFAWKLSLPQFHFPVGLVVFMFGLRVLSHAVNDVMIHDYS